MPASDQEETEKNYTNSTSCLARQAKTGCIFCGKEYSFYTPYKAEMLRMKLQSLLCNLAGKRKLLYHTHSIMHKIYI